MAYRRIRADKVFDGYRMHADKVLVLSGDGRVNDLIPSTEAGPDTENHAGILCPGLINAHCHLELSHMKGLIPEQTGLVDFVYKVVTERHHPEETILQKMEDAEQEMTGNGIVAVGDICNNLLSLHQKQKGRMRYYNFIEASGWLPAVAGQRFERALSLYQAYSKRGPTSIIPHAPYSVSTALWERIRPWFKDRVVSIHNQETAFEDAFFLDGSGDFTRMYQLMNLDNSHHVPTKKTSLISYFDQLCGAARILLVHNTFTGQQDLDYIRNSCVQSDTSLHEKNVFFCLCPNANRYIEQSFPPVKLLRDNGCRIVLGTDSLASNWSLNILDEIRTLRQNAPEIPLEEMLRWATSNGAAALDMDKELGSFETGKNPGMALISEGTLTVKKLD